MPTAAEIERQIRNRETECLDVLGDLVSIPSGDPPGDTTEAADYVATLLSERGIDHEVIAPKDDRPTVVGHFEGNSAGPHLTFNGHLDTFSVSDPESWERDPRGETADGRFYGRGVADMLAGLTASTIAFLYLHEHREDVRGTVTLAAVSDEESGGKWGAEYLTENHPEYTGDAVINGEPAHPDLVCFGEYGNVWIDVQVDGESVPTSFAQGTNANDVLIDLLSAIRSLREAEFDLPEWITDLVADATGIMPENADLICEDGTTDQYLDAAVRVGRMGGGEKVNLRADHAQAEVDVRVPLGVDVHAVIDRIRGFASEYPTADIEVFQQTPGTYSDPEDPVFEGISKSVAQVRGSEPAFTYTYAFSDLRYYRQVGVPGVWYGPTPYNVGRADEYVHIDEFMDVVAVHALASARFLGLIG